MSETTSPRVPTSRPGAGRPPARAQGVVVWGEVPGSGYAVAPSLARRADGQTVQLTPLLHAVLEAVDGDAGIEEVAAQVRERTGRPVSADNVDVLLEKLREQGLVRLADGSEPELRRTNPLLGLSLRVQVSDPERTRRLTAPFARLFNPVLVVLVLAVFGWACWWLLVTKGLASATSEAFGRPGLLLSLLVLTALSAGFHEFGHAAAARRGGATPGVMGAGLYLVWPAFYTDVTDTYRLGRSARLVTDLGGLYFNAIVVVASVGAWWVTRVDAVLLLVVAQVLQMVRQLLPLVRFDGYHVLADLTGVPDLYGRIGPTLRSWLPGRSEPAATALKPWARVVITAWVLLVIPLMVIVLTAVVLALPRLVGTAVAGAQREWSLASASAGDADWIGTLGHALGAGLVLLPVAAIAYLLLRLVRRLVPATWRATAGRPLRRSLAVVLALALVSGLVAAWWPQPERYRPVQPWEGGTLADLVSYTVPGSTSAGTVVGSRGTGTVVLPAGAAAPTRERPQLAAVLVPRDPEAPGTDQVVEAGDVGSADGDTWIFPFDQPPAPDQDDTQALAVADEDGESVYDVAFALIWADGSSAPVQTDNEAYALASCEGCSAVAVAFQVVLVVGDGAALAPTNVAVSVNQDCTSCLTWSTAVQLFVTLDGPLGEEAMGRLEELWTEVVEYGATIGQQPLDEIQSTLTAFEQQVLAIVEADQGPLTDPTTTASTDPSATASGTPTGSTTPTGSPTATGSPSASTSGSSTPPGSPTGSSNPSASAAPSGSSSPSRSPSPTSTPSGSTTGSTSTPSGSPSASASP